MPGTAKTKLKGNCMATKKQEKRGRSEDEMKVAGRVADNFLKRKMAANTRVSRVVRHIIWLC